MIRILNAEPFGFSPEASAILGEIGEVVEAHTSRAELVAQLPSFDALIVRLGIEIDDEVLSAGSRLRVIATPTTGLDHIDKEAAARREIAVLSLRGELGFLETIASTAEATWGLLLALVRRLPAAAASVTRGEWDRDRHRGRELFGKRLGLVGLGRVGRRVAQFGDAFGMHVAAYDPFVSSWPDSVRRYSDLRQLLADSDVVSLHVHLDGSTRGLIGKAELDSMRPDAVLVNTARGEVVDEDAIVSALLSRQLAGAALDVVVGERSEDRAEALRAYAATHDNLIVTPHIGGATCEAMSRTEVFMARKLVAFLRGSPTSGGG